MTRGRPARPAARRCRPLGAALARARRRRGKVALDHRRLAGARERGRRRCRRAPRRAGGEPRAARARARTCSQATRSSPRPTRSARPACATCRTSTGSGSSTPIEAARVISLRQRRPDAPRHEARRSRSTRIRAARPATTSSAAARSTRSSTRAGARPSATRSSRHRARARRADPPTRGGRDRRRPRRVAAQPAAAVRHRRARRRHADRSRGRPARWRSPSGSSCSTTTRRTGPGIAEVLDAGFGLVPGLVVLPDPRRRLRLDDRERVARLGAAVRARRSASRMDHGARVVCRRDGRLARRDAATLAAHGRRRPRRAMAERDARRRRTPTRGDRHARDRRARRPAPRTPRGGRRVPRRAHVPDRRGRDDHVRLARRGRGRPPQALGLRPAVVAAARARRRAPTSGTSPSSCRPARASSTSSRSSAAATASWIEDPLNPNRARDPFGANSVAARRRLRGPGVDRSPIPRRGPGSLDELFVRQPDASAGARVGIYLPARFRRTRRYPLLVVHDGHDYLRYAGMQDRPRQPHPPPRDPRPDRGAHQLARPAARVRQRRAPRPLPHRGAGARTSSGRLPLDEPAAGPLPDGRELRRGGRALDRLALARASTAGCCSSPARSRSPTSATATTAARCSTRSSQFVNQFRSRPGARQPSGCS